MKKKRHAFERVIQVKKFILLGRVNTRKGKYMLIFNIQLQRKFETDKYLQSTRKNQARNYELIIIKKAVS